MTHLVFCPNVILATHNTHAWAPTTTDAVITNCITRAVVLKARFRVVAPGRKYATTKVSSVSVVLINHIVKQTGKIQQHITIVYTSPYYSALYT